MPPSKKTWQSDRIEVDQSAGRLQEAPVFGQSYQEIRTLDSILSLMVSARSIQ